MLTVCGSATDDRLTTLANAKELLQLTDSADEQFLDRLIVRASRRIRNYCGREFSLQTYQDILPSYGRVYLQLPEYPITQVLRVFDGSDTGTDTELSATEYRVDKAEGRLYREAGWAWTAQVQEGALTTFPPPDSEARRWLVEWSAGYTGPDGTTSTGHGASSTGSTLPADLEDACLELVKASYKARSRPGDVQSESVGDVSVTYKAGGTRVLPETVEDLLAAYRSVI